MKDTNLGIVNGMRLHVMLISPVVLPISPRLKYAGTERVIDALNEKFTKDYQVNSIVAASGDSDLRGFGLLIYSRKRSLWSLGGVVRKITRFREAFEKHYEYCIDYLSRNRFDIIHDNATFISSTAYNRRMNEVAAPIVFTIHGDVNKPDEPNYKVWRLLQRDKAPVYFASISKSQKRNFERRVGIKVSAVIYNGIPVESFPFVDKDGKQDYILWLGRICGQKGTDLAIKVAQVTHRPLIVAGEVQTIYRKYYEKEVKPHITRFLDEKPDVAEKERDELVAALERGEKIINPGEILFIGPLDDRQKKVVYSRAYAHMVLNRWEEPFGLIMPEAMATGTPVIGTRRGAIPEIVQNNVTGFVIPIKFVNKRREIVDEKQLLRAAIRALEKIPNIKPIDCRRRVEELFSADAMARGYLKLYRKILREESKYGIAQDHSGQYRAVQRGTATLP